LIPDFIEALTVEIELYSRKLVRSKVRTIYIGGGTPNLIPTGGFQKIISILNQYFHLDQLREFTVELNPANINQDFIKVLKDNYVNRISIGCQSYSNKELSILGRIHSVDQIQSTIDTIKKYHFHKINLDFIFGIPKQSLASWKKNLEKAVDTGVTHLSLYNLTYEPQTPLTKYLEQGKYMKPDEDLEWQMYEYAHDYLRENNFAHYEISNWAKPGNQSIHNQAYWEGNDYIGFGPAAHSYYSKTRRWNKSNLNQYINRLKENKLPPMAKESIDHNKHRLEKLFLSLRTDKGIELKTISELYNIQQDTVKSLLSKRLNHFINKFIIFDNNFLKLTLEGWFLSNSIISNISDLLDQYNNRSQP